MSDISRKQQSRHARRSIFWPVVLIIVGVIFLAYNTGALEGDAWDIMFNLWPLLLVLIGLDSLLDRSGVVWPSLMIGLGTVFLANNFGLLALDVWQAIASLWPLLLVAIGIDVFVGRRSFLLSLLGVILILALLVWSITWLSGSQRAGDTRSLEYDTGSATQARITVDIPAGSLHLRALDRPGLLLAATVPDHNAVSLAEHYRVDGGRADLVLNTTGGFRASPGSLGQYPWDLQVTPAVPLDLEVKWGAGEIDLDLTHLDLSALVTDFGVGQVSIVLPAQGGFTAEVNGGVGLLRVAVPEGLGVEIIPDTALVRFEVPDEYRKVDGRYYSPGYENAEQQVSIKIDLAVGSVVID